MDNETTYDTIVRMTSKYTLEPMESNSKFLTDLGLDSLDFVLLIIEIEEKYGIHIEDEDAQTCSTIQDLQDIVDELR